MHRLPAAGLLVALAACTAATSAPPADPDRHARPLVERDGRTLLWAGEGEDGEPEWFDVTGAALDPAALQFGIGKDTIPSIDAPEHVAADDPRLAERGVGPETEVLGVVVGGIARAYPVRLLSLREVVNDDFAGRPHAVLW